TAQFRDVRLSDTQRNALRRLVDDGILSAAQEEAVRSALDSAQTQRRSPEGWLAEAAGYVGGCLLLAGVVSFLSTSWDSLNRPERSVLLAGFAVACAGAGVAAAGGPRQIIPLRESPAPGRRRIVGVLFAVAAAVTVFAVGVACASWEAVAGGLAGLVIACTGYVLLPTVPGILACAATSLVAAAALADELMVRHDGDGSALSGLFMLALGIIWTGIAATRRVPPLWLPFTIGVGLALFGAQQLMGDSSMEPLSHGVTFLVALGSFALYRRYGPTVLLILGVIGVTIAVPEAVAYWTHEAVGGALILVVAGATLVAASVVGLRMRKAAPAGMPSATAPSATAPAPTAPAAESTVRLPPHRQ
ncbi:MAG: hypothetical protein JXA67_14530, partial [Micromonosporaceae bacterium]|nr:hypothetical protein [Micromonosporaceae bacterium]